MAQFRTTQDVSAATTGISTYAEIVRITANGGGSSSLYLPDVGGNPIIGRGHTILIVAATSSVTSGVNIKPNPSDIGFEVDGVVAKLYDIDDAGIAVTYAGDGKWFTSMNASSNFQIIITDTLQNGDNNILIPTGTPNAALTAIGMKYVESRVLLTGNNAFGSWGGSSFEIKPRDATNYSSLYGRSEWGHNYTEVAGVPGSGGIETLYIELPHQSSPLTVGGQYMIHVNISCWDDTHTAYYCASIYIMAECDQATYGSMIINAEQWTIIADTGDFLLDLQQIASDEEIIGIQVDNNSGNDGFVHFSYRLVSQENLTI